MPQEEKDKLDLVIKRYKLDDLLLLIAEKSREMYLKGVALETIEWYHKISDQKFSQIMPIWGLSELSYRAICNCNDHRSVEAGFEDLCELNNLLAEVTDNKAGGKSSYTSHSGAQAALILGLSQAQLWWQKIARDRNSIVYDFLRYYLLLYKIPTVVIGENKTFRGPEAYSRKRGVRLIDLDLPECKQMMRDFIIAKPELWNEDVGK